MAAVLASVLGVALAVLIVVWRWRAQGQSLRWGEGCLSLSVGRVGVRGVCVGWVWVWVGVGARGECGCDLWELPVPLQPCMAMK